MGEGREGRGWEGKEGEGREERGMGVCTHWDFRKSATMQTKVILYFLTVKRTSTLSLKSNINEHIVKTRLTEHLQSIPKIF